MMEFIQASEKNSAANSQHRLYPDGRFQTHEIAKGKEEAQKGEFNKMNYFIEEENINFDIMAP